jgi:shikimate kinase
VDWRKSAGRPDAARSREDVGEIMRTNIALIGFMGTGKTEVGKVLAEKLGKEFIEIDGLLKKSTGQPIAEIFRTKGETFFRDLEIEAVKEISGKKNAVIACGGGIVLNKINIDRLKQSSIIVLLTAAPAIILKRTAKDNGDRPLLNVADRQTQIAGLLKFREPFYERSAEITINTSSLDVKAVADKIAESVGEYESQHRKK